MIARLRGTGEKGLVVVLAEAYLSLCARICLPASAGLCSLIAGGGNGKPFLRTVPLLFSSHLVRGDCTGQDVVDCGAWLTRTPRRRIVYLFNDPSFLLFFFFFAVDVLSQMCGGDVLTVISRRFRDGESFATTSFLLAAMWRRVCSVPYLA